MALVLVIDDSLFMRMQLNSILGQAGHQVLQAADGLEGLDVVAQAEPHCIILDLLMPGLDGPGFLRQLRERGVASPVIVHTADIQDSTRRICLDLGARAFLNKPPMTEELLEALAMALQG